MIDISAAGTTSIIVRTNPRGIIVRTRPSTNLTWPCSNIRHNNPMRRHCQFTVKRPEKGGVLTVAPEQQPCCVQVVEWVGLVVSGFQFLLGLAAVFAEEVGDFGFIVFDGLI